MRALPAETQLVSDLQAILHMRMQGWGCGIRSRSHAPIGVEPAGPKQWHCSQVPCTCLRSLFEGTGQPAFASSSPSGSQCFCSFRMLCFGCWLCICVWLPAAISATVAAHLRNGGGEVSGVFRRI